MCDGFSVTNSVPVLSHAFDRQVDTVPSEVKPMLLDKDYKDMLTRWGTASDSDWLALPGAHDVEEPIQPKVDEQFPKQKRQRRAAPAQYGDMADAFAGIVPMADAPALLALENLAPAVEDAADSCVAPAFLSSSAAHAVLEGSPTAVDDTEKQPPSHTPVPAAQDHMAKTGAGATIPQIMPATTHAAIPAPLPLPSLPSPKAMFASSSSSSTAECCALAVPPPPLPHTPPAVALHVF